MKMTRTRNLLAAALATALLSPLAWAQSDNAAAGGNKAGQQAQQVPNPALPPAVTPRLPADTDPRTPVASSGDPQRAEQPMTSSSPPPHSQAAERAAEQSAVAQRTTATELDTDRDGLISADEAKADTEFESHFSMMDSDSDGYVSPTEYREHARAMNQGVAGNPDAPPAPPTQSQGAANAAAHSAVAQRELQARLDTDGDGRISSVEASLDTEFSAQFRVADADGDGYITDDEYRAHARNIEFTGDAPIDEEDVDDIDENEMDEDVTDDADDDRDGG